MKCKCSSLTCFAICSIVSRPFQPHFSARIGDWFQTMSLLQPHNIHIAGLSFNMQECCAVMSSLCFISANFDQQPHNIHMAVLASRSLRIDHQIHLDPERPLGHLTRGSTPPLRQIHIKRNNPQDHYLLLRDQRFGTTPPPKTKCVRVTSCNSFWVVKWPSAVA